MGYKPNGMEMWDAWGIEHNGRMHLFHLQFLSPHTKRTQQEADHLGYAVSSDLIRWEEQPPALSPGAAGEADDMQPWTGTVWKEGERYYLYYTMRSTRDQARGQRIGVAFSEDLKDWRRYEGNPVIEPDPRWYVSHQRPLPSGVVDCRDLIVVKPPDAPGWLGFYAARTHGEELGEGAVIALVRSDDLLHWEHLPPAFVAAGYACVEVPEVFELGGRWYMTCLTSHIYGNRGIYREDGIVSGTIYAVADRPEGPYRECPSDHLLFGGDESSGYSFRSFLYEGKRYGMYTERESNTLSPPFEVIVTREGHLRLGYSARTALWRTERLLASDRLAAPERLPLPHANWGLPGGRWRVGPDGYVGEARTGWQVAGLCASGEDVELAATVTVQDGLAAGLAVLGDWEAADSGGTLVVMLDARAGMVQAGLAPIFGEPWRRRWPIALGQPYRLRVMVRRPRVEVYVDDVLALQFAWKAEQTASASRRGIGLFVDRAQALVSEVEAYALQVGSDRRAPGTTDERGSSESETPGSDPGDRGEEELTDEIQ